MKISQRISIGFILVMILFFILSSLAFTVIAKQAYLSEAREDLRREVTYLTSEPTLLLRIVAGEKRRVSRDPAELTFLIDSQLIIVNNKDEIIYSEEEEEDVRILEAISQGRDLEDIIYIKREIDRDIFSGTLVLYYPIEEIQQALTMNRRAGIWGLLVALPITALLAWYIQRRISKPIQKLKGEMDLYSEEKGMQAQIDGNGDEVAVLADSFDALKETIDENERNREMLFSNISHELKTPLMTIRGYAEGIQEGVIDQEYGLKTIVEETARLNEFAKKVLMLSKLSGQALNRETVDLGQLLEGTFQRYQPMAAQKGLELDLQKQAKPLSFCLDEERYRQAIGNLIANALRYASSRIILGSLMEADRVGIYVEDDGSGVPPHKIDAIFTRFEKGEKGQTGLGLAIVKRIMVQHEGDVVAENRKEGFRVTMWFPTE